MGLYINNRQDSIKVKPGCLERVYPENYERTQVPAFTALAGNY